MNKLTFALALLSLSLFGCGKDDDNPDPAKSSQSPALEGKWNTQSWQTQTFNTDGSPNQTLDRQADAGSQLEFLKGGTFNDYEDFKVITSGNYTLTGSKIVFSVPSATIPPKYIDQITATDLVLRDTTIWANNTTSIRVTKYKR